MLQKDTAGAGREFHNLAELTVKNFHVHVAMAKYVPGIAIAIATEHRITMQ